MARHGYVTLIADTNDFVGGGSTNSSVRAARDGS
jgi:hypothetical protein